MATCLVVFGPLVCVVTAACVAVGINHFFAVRRTYGG